MSNPNPEAAPIQQVIDEVQKPAATGFPLEVQIPGTPTMFRGNTPQEVLDQLVHAQSEAHRTIVNERAERQLLQNQITALQQQIPRPSTSEAEELEKRQQRYNTWAKNPTEATKQDLAELFGVPADRVVELMKKAITSGVVNTAADEFLQRCPEFPQTPQTAALIKGALSQRFGNGPDAATADNLEIVYHQLVREGRLMPNTLPTSAVMNGNMPIPSIRGGSAPQNPVNDIMRQAQDMPLEKLKEVIDRLSSQTR